MFARIPTDWVKYDNIGPEVRKIIENFFRNVSHVNAVVFVWEEWIELQDNRRANVIKFRPELHPSPRYIVENLDELILSRQIPTGIKGSYAELSFGVFRDEDFDKAIRINPNDAMAYNNRGNAYANKGEYDKAIQDFTKAIKINPSLAISYSNRGFAYYNKGEYDRAIQGVVHFAQDLSLR